MVGRFWIALSIVQHGQSLNTVLNMKEKKRENLKEIRAYIKVRHKFGLNSKDIYSEIYDIFGIKKVSYRTVLRWIARFRSGQESLKDNAKSGRSRASSSKINVENQRHINERWKIYHTTDSFFSRYITSKNTSYCKACSQNEEDLCSLDSTYFEKWTETDKGTFS